MPNQIEPYAPGPGSLANTVVGTPGVDRQAGSEWFKLADAAGQAREGIARNQISSAGQMFGMLDQIAGAFGAAIGRHAFAKQKQSNYLNMSAVNTKAYEFQSALNAKQNVFKQQYADDPQNATGALGEMVDNNAPGLNGQPSFVNDRGEAMDVKSIMNWAQNDASLKNDPQALAHLQDRLMSIRQQKLDQTEDWAFTARTKNAESSNDIARHDVVSSISMQSGDMGTRYKDYQELMANAKQRIADNSPILGTIKTQLDSIKLDKDAGFAYIDSGIASAPDEPTAALMHLADVRTQLNNAAHLGIDIEPQAKITLQGKIETAENHYIEDLKHDAMAGEVLDTSSIAERRIKLSLNYKNTAMQQQAKLWVSDQLKEVNKSIAAVQANTILPTKAKNAIIGRLTGQMSKLDGLVTEADNNMRRNDSDARQVESDRRREASDLRRENNDARRLQHEVERDQKAEQAEKGRVLSGEISNLEDELHQLMVKPVENKLAIIQKAAEISAAADKGLAGQLLTLSNAKRTLKGALDVVQEAAQYKEKPGFLGLFPSTVERIKPQGAKRDQLGELQKRQAEYVASMEQLRRDQSQLKTDDNINQMVLGMNGAQREHYNEVWPIMLKALRARKFNDAQIAQKKNQFVSQVFQKFPSTSPKKIQGAPPPPGPKDMQIDLHPHLIQGNSSKPSAGFKAPPKAVPPKLSQVIGSEPKTEVAKSSGYAGIPKPSGLIEQGNLDLTNRQVVRFPHGLDGSNSTAAARQQYGPASFPKGSIATEFSTSISTDGKLFIIPTVFAGKVHSTNEAVKQFQKTGEHMGVFEDSEDGIKQAEAYAEALHNRKMDVKA